MIKETLIKAFPYHSYKEFPSVSPEAAAFLGIDVATANRLWERTVALYVGESDREKVPAVERQAQILGCIRIIDYMDRHSDFKDSEPCIEVCKRDIYSSLSDLSVPRELFFL